MGHRTHRSHAEKFALVNLESKTLWRNGLGEAKKLMGHTEVAHLAAVI
jgi:hypothetical protein